MVEEAYCIPPKKGRERVKEKGKKEGIKQLSSVRTFSDM